MSFFILSFNLMELPNYSVYGIKSSTSFSHLWYLREGGMFRLSSFLPPLDFPEREHSTSVILRAVMRHLHGTNTNTVFLGHHLLKYRPRLMLHNDGCSDGNRDFTASCVVEMLPLQNEISIFEPNNKHFFQLKKNIYFFFRF